MARPGLYQLISWTLMAMKMMKGACRKHSSCPFLLALLVEHCGTHRSFIVHVSGSSFKSRWHLFGRRLWQISHRLLRSQLCCLMPGSSRLEIVTLLPNAETIYILTNGNLHKVSDMCPVVPAWFSIAKWAQRLLQRSFYTLVQTLQDRIPLMTWSSSATSGYIWNLDLIVSPCCDRLRFQKYTPALLHPMVLATDPNMGPQMHHHFASLCAHYLYGTM